MSNDITGGLRNLKGGNIDELRGPYATVAAANLAIPNTIVDGVNYREGKFVDIGSAANYVTYWWKGGYADADLTKYIDLDAELNQKIPNSQKAASNGVATLDAAGKVPLSQLNTSTIQYKGLYDPSTNTPNLTDATGSNGFLYIISDAGTRNFGSGNVVLNPQDIIVHNGTKWERSKLDLVTLLSLNYLSVIGLNDQYQDGVTDYNFNGVGSMLRTERRRTHARPVALSAIFNADPISAVASFVDFHGIDISGNGGDNMNSFSRLYPFESTARFNASILAELGKAVGGYLQVTNIGLGNILDAVNLRIRMSNTNTGKITKGIGIHLEAPINSGGGSIDLYYALKIESIALAGSTFYGIACDVLRNYFSSLQIGVNVGANAPTELLMVGRAGNGGTVGFYGQTSGKSVLRAQAAAGDTVAQLPIRSGILATRAFYDATLIDPKTSGQMNTLYPLSTYQVGDVIIGTVYQYTRITNLLWSRTAAIIP